MTAPLSPVPARHVTALLPALLLLPLLGAAGCSNAPHIDSNVAHEYRSATDLGPVHRGWNRVWVGRVMDRPRVISHHIEVQADLAGELVRMSGGEREAAAAEHICPPAADPIWNRLVDGQDIEVQFSTRKNGPFATVSCRDAVF